MARTYEPGDGRVLTRALAAARDGDALRVSGRCVGNYSIGSDVTLTGVATPSVPVATLVGRAAGATVTVGDAAARMSNLVITNLDRTVEGGNGRGILNYGTLTVVKSTVRGNTAYIGGGIFNEGVLTLDRSTVSGNTGGHGGGIYNVATLSLRRSTVADNVSEGDGGGIYDEGALLVSHSTISDNTAGFEGGGLYLTRDEVFEASIVAGNMAGASGPDCAGPATSNGYNLVGDTDGDFCAFEPAVGNRVGSGGGLVDAQLQPLAQNGGPTKTMALDRTSPAVNAIPVGAVGVDGTVLCMSGTRDQRGVLRPQGPACDQGAYELRQ